MKFKVLRKSYLFGQMVEAGETFDFPNDQLPRDNAGKIRFDKMSQLEPLEPVAPVVDHDDDGAQGNQGDGKAGLNEQEIAQAISAAVASLDVTNDEHWTATGLPSVDQIAALAGFKVTRKEIETVAPGFKRA